MFSNFYGYSLSFLEDNKTENTKQFVTEKIIYPKHVLDIHNLCKYS